MATLYGLIIRDGNGNVILDPTVRAGRIIGSFMSGLSPGSIHVPEFVTQGAGFGIALPLGGSNYFCPMVDVDGQTLRWYWDNNMGFTANSLIFYGVR